MKEKMVWEGTGDVPVGPAQTCQSLIGRRKTQHEPDRQGDPNRQTHIPKKAWNIPVSGFCSIDIWQGKVETRGELLKGG